MYSSMCIKGVQSALRAWPKCAPISCAYAPVHSESSLSNPLTPEYALRYSEHTLNVLKYAQSYFFLSVAEDIRSMLQCAQYVVCLYESIISVCVPRVGIH